MYSRRCAVGLALALLVPLVPAAAAAQQGPTASEPVLITSCGQSPGPLKVKVFAQRLGIDHEYDPLATAEDLTAAKESDTPFRSIIVVTGASLKGMGAAGISVEEELARVDALLDEAEAQGLTIVGAHVEGMARRAQGASPGDNSDEQSIDAVCPRSDMLMVRSDGNEDGRFTAIATDRDIPLLEFEKNLELGEVLKDIYGK
ncbi:MAG: DUF6305 family protein [bacterium]